MPTPSQPASPPAVAVAPQPPPSPGLKTQPKKETAKTPAVPSTQAPPSVHIEQNTQGGPAAATTGPHSPITINPAVNPNASIVTYDFDGSKRTVTPATGTTDLDDKTPQVGAFHRMGGIERQKDWVALRDVAEQEIKNTPEWLTPYVFSGRAHALLTDVDKAIERLDFVIKQSAGREDYEIAKRDRESIRRQFGR